VELSASSLPATPLSSEPPSESRRITFHGDGGALFGVHIVNLLLSIVTLGIYYFWGKTRARQYTHRQLAFDGDRFAYDGTGRELFSAFLKGLLIIVPLYALYGFLQFRAERNPALVLPAALLFAATFLIINPIVMVGSRRYRMSRASWRGIRFSFRGTAREFIRIFATGTILSTLTLGLYVPHFTVNMWRFLINHSYYGSQRFAFEGRGRDLFWHFIVAIVLTIPTLGICWFWYTARQQRYLWAGSSFGSMGFRSSVRGGALFGLAVSNVLLLIFTLGLAFPWVIVRNLRFIARTVAAVGPMALETVRQEAQPAPALGEGIADFLGLDFIGLTPS
jgi:uncharacterized membrane protein YjgN (DUF898 family)